MKAQTKAILVSLVVIAVALSAVSGVTYSWWSDSENTDINVSTGALDVKVLGDISYSSEEGSSGFFTVNKANPVKSGTTTSLNLITDLSNVAPNDVYYIDYLVQYETTVFAQYLTFVGDDSPWIDVKVESYNQSTLVDGVITSTENGFTLMKWKNIPDNDTLEPGSLYVANEYVRVTITIGDNAPMNADSTVQIINEITQRGNLGIWDGTVPDSLDKTTLEIVPDIGADTGTITVNSAADLVYLNTLTKVWAETYSDGQGTDWSNYNKGEGREYYYHGSWDIVLATDLDMNDIPMDSVDISYWGTFDGGNNTISNVVLNEGQNGLFNNGAKAINNLIIRNIVVDAPEVNRVGALAGIATSTNVHVENATVTGGKYVGGLVGQGSSFTNCSVKDSVVIGSNDQKTVGGLVGYSVGDPGAATVTGNLVENVTVIGAYNVGGLLGQSQNETVENNTVRDVTVKSTRELPTDASSNEVRAAELAARSAFDNTSIKTNTIENVTVIEVAYASDDDGLSNTLNGSGTFDVVLDVGNYKLPSVSSGDVTISGTKDTVITVEKPNYSGSDLTLSGVTVKGSGYSTGVQHVDTVTYNDVKIVGEMCLYGEKVVFNDCSFELSANQYIWTYGAREVEFNDCIFNTVGKAILIYNEGAGGSTVTVKGCTFNATAGAKAGAIANQNCAAIEIDNFQTTTEGDDGIDNGVNHVLITKDNSWDSDFFSGEWRIKNYEKSGIITVNDKEYTSIAIDGKLMTIDSNKNVTVS